MERSSSRCPSRIPAALVALALALSLCPSVDAASVGGESGAFLRGPVGATAFAMGGAGAASPQYLTSWSNPAMLSVLKTRSVGLGVGLRSQGRTEAFGSFSFRVPPRVGMGFSFVYRGDPFINDLHDADENPLGRGAYTALALKTGISYFLNRKLSAGVSIGIYHQSLPTYIASDNQLSNSRLTRMGGFDLALRYRAGDSWACAIMYRNLGSSMDWEIQTSSFEGYGTRYPDRPLQEAVFAGRLDRLLSGKPFSWSTDLVGYLFDSDGNKMERPEAVWYNGFEWKRWQRFYVRAGISDLVLSGRIVNNSSDYFHPFSFRITAGFSAELTRLRPGVWVNYAVATDKVWAGVDQTIDLTYTF